MITPHRSTKPVLDRPQIIMQFTTSPTLEDVRALALLHVDTLPEEILEKCSDLTIEVEDFPDSATEQDQGLSDPYELLALFRPAGQISPGVTKKVKDGIDTLTLYRRPILDVWCEGSEELQHLVRQIMIGELGAALDFAEADVDEMIARHYQGLL